MTWLALAATALGVFLGGVWAKDNLGRFGAGTLKETGAIVLAWDAIMILFCWRRPAATHVAMLLAFAGNVVVAAAWFGPGLLADGLHSYGPPCRRSSCSSFLRTWRWSPWDWPRRAACAPRFPNTEKRDIVDSPRQAPVARPGFFYADRLRLNEGEGIVNGDYETPEDRATTAEIRTADSGGISARTRPNGWFAYPKPESTPSGSLRARDHTVTTEQPAKSGWVTWQSGSWASIRGEWPLVLRRYSGGREGIGLRASSARGYALATLQSGFTLCGRNWLPPCAPEGGYDCTTRGQADGQSQGANGELCCE